MRIVLAVFAALALVGCSTGQTVPAVPASSPVVDCAALPEEPDLPDVLAEGIAQVRLCQEPGNELALVAPPDALVVDADAVARAYNALEVAELATLACPEDFGPAYRLAVAYPDGTVVTLRGEQYGCSLVGNRLGSDAVLTAFGDALWAQRTTQPATPVEPPDDLCRGEASWLVPDLADTVRGVACLPDAAGQLQQRPFSEEDWATLAADAAAHPRTPTPLPPDAVCDALALPTLVGVAATGEVVWVPASCAAYEWGPGRGATHGWEPTGAARTLLEGLV